MNRTRSRGSWAIMTALMLAVTTLACSPAATTNPTTPVGDPTTTAATPTSVSLDEVTSTTDGAVALDDAAIPQAPVEFTGRIKCGPPLRSDSTETIDVGNEAIVLNRYRGGAWQQTVTMTDPRLEGSIYQTWESDEYRLAGAEEGPSVWAATWRIRNEQGVWVSLGIGATFVDGTQIGDPSDVDRDTWDPQSVLIGEGAYEGLIAVMEVVPLDSGCTVEVRGIIFDGAPVPQPYVP